MLCKLDYSLHDLSLTVTHIGILRDFSHTYFMNVPRKQWVLPERQWNLYRSTCLDDEGKHSLRECGIRYPLLWLPSPAPRYLLLVGTL